MIGVEQWRASIGLYHSGTHRQLAHILRKTQPAVIVDYFLLELTALILSELLTHGPLFVAWILANGYSLYKEELMALKKTSGTQLLCTADLAVVETHSGNFERSVRAMAILLIVAGDVEQNPGPLPSDSASPESRALRYHSASLITAITEPLRLSWKLFSAGIIEKATKDKANLPIMTTEEKNDVLLSAVMSRVDTDPSIFHQFLDLLKDDGDDILKSLGGKLETTFNDFTKGDRERGTLDQSPVKQPEFSPSHIETQPLQPYHPSPVYPHMPPTTHPHPSPLYSHMPPTTHPHPSPVYPFITRPPSPQPTRQVEHSHPQSATYSPPQSPFSFFVNYLKSFYNSEVPLSFCKFPPVPKKKFINLAIISREKVSSEELKQFMLATLHGNVDQIFETKAPITIENLLDTEVKESLHCVLIEGAPGVGKTTLSWEICKRWGRGELFQQYAVVILLRLRDRTVQEAKNIMDLISYMYYSEHYKTDISQYLEGTNGQDILIILEGLDELPKHLLDIHQPSIFTRLLSRHILPYATVLVTSRPSATVQLRKGWEISRHIEVLGFTEEDISDYIQSALSPQERPAFDSYLSTYPNIRLTMYIPLNCAIVVEVYRSCQQSSRPPPTTTTELYTCLVQTILLRYLDGNPKYKENATDIDEFTDLPPPVYHHFYKLTEMAYRGVQSQQLVFYDQRKPIEHLGFMDTVTELFTIKHTVSYSYNFLHLSVQEYLAAYFVSLKSADEQHQLLQTMYTETHLRNVGLFLAGITKFRSMERATVKAIIDEDCGEDLFDALVLSPYTLQLLHESGDYSIIDGHPSYSCTLTDYNTLLDFSVLGHCIANSSYTWRLRLGSYGQYIQSTDRIALLLQTLKNHSNPGYTIERVDCFYAALESVQLLLLELPQYILQQIQTLVLISEKENPHPLLQCVFEHSLSKMSGLHSLGLHDGALSTSGAVAIADIIKNKKTIRHVELKSNDIGDEGMKVLDEIREIRKDLQYYKKNDAIFFTHYLTKIL